MAITQPGTVNPKNPNYIMGNNNQWVLKSTTGAGGLNPATPATPTPEVPDTPAVNAFKIPTSPLAPQPAPPQPTPQVKATEPQQPIAGQGVQIANEADLQAKREELGAAGIAEADFSKFISSPTADDPRLFFRQPATLTSPTGEKKVVATGSQEANDLFKSGFTLGGGFNDQVVSSDTLAFERPVNIGDPTERNVFVADTVSGGFNSTISGANDEIKRLQQMLIEEAPETDDSRTLKSLIGSLDPDALTGRGAAQLSEEEKRDIEEKTQNLISKTAELKQKSDEINALTSSYNLANQTEEGRPQTLSRLQGTQAQNYKMYLAQKNGLTADAAFIQSDLLAMQNQLEASQDAANRAVDLMFSDKEAQYNATIAKINILAPQVAGDEARYLAGIQLDLQRQQAGLADAKADQKSIQGLKLNYIEAMLKAGQTPSSGVLSDFGKAQSLDQAIDILAQNSPVASAAGGGKFTRIGTDEFGDPIYGFVNEAGGTVLPFGGGSGNYGYTGPVVPGGAGSITDASGATYDIGNYAIDSGHPTSVQAILDGMGQMTSFEQMDDYIQSKAPGSQVTGEMIANASEKTGASWEAIMALMQKESTFGTSNVAINNNNVAGISNVGPQGTSRPSAEGGYYTKFNTMQDGVNALAQNLAGRRTDGQAPTEEPIGYQPTGNTIVDGLVANVMNDPSLLGSDNKILTTRQKQSVTSALAQQGLEIPQEVDVADRLQESISRQKSQQALDLKTHPGLDNAVGINPFGRTAFTTGQATQKQEFLGSVQQLVSGLSLEALIEAKSRGATFGALSDTEMQILSSAATQIGTWAIRDKNGKVKGYKIGHDAMRKELDNISKNLARGLTPERQIMPNGDVVQAQPDGTFIIIN